MVRPRSARCWGLAWRPSAPPPLSQLPCESLFASLAERRIAKFTNCRCNCEPLMSYHIKEILLNDTFERYTVMGQSEGEKRLSNLSKMNIFVGENNSGKSRFLRRLAAIKQLQFTPNIEGKKDS